MSESTSPENPSPAPKPDKPPIAGVTTIPHKEIGGRDGPEPTRYGDWERNGRCIDF